VTDVLSLFLSLFSIEDSDSDQEEQEKKSSVSLLFLKNCFFIIIGQSAYL
jgi:hypothetical protein